MVAGVYLIVNKETGQKYAGGSTDIERRIKDHTNSPNKGSYIDNAIQKYGFDSFDWQVIEELPADWKIIGEREKYWINFYNTFKDPEHYNLTEGGEGMCGWIPSEETRKKISKNYPDISGKNHPLYGKKKSKETRKKMSESQSQKKNITGYYRVHKVTINHLKQGFHYRYQYHDINGKRHQINSVSLEKLEKKVKNAGLPWKILDEEKALKTLNDA